MPRQHGQTDALQEEPIQQRGGAEERARSPVARRRALARSALIVLTFARCDAIAGPADPPGALPALDAARLAQAAQMIVRVTLISRNCAPFYAVDQAQLQEIGNALVTQSIARYGKDRLVRAMNSAEAEDTAQIRQSGAAFWCPLQRAYLNSLRMPGLIGKQRY